VSPCSTSPATRQSWVDHIDKFKPAGFIEDQTGADTRCGTEGEISHWQGTLWDLRHGAPPNA
jgi:hypothetical protein